jgi:hypothetical protein
MTKPTDPGDDTRRDNSIFIDRVRKLMDKAAATTNPHEAEAFSRKAAELISRHRIDPERLRARAGTDLRVRSIPLGRGAYVRARLALLTAIAESQDVRVLFSSTPAGMEAHAAGFADDLDAVETLYHSLHTQASAQMAAVRRSTPAATQRYRRSFLFGYADRIGQLLVESRAKVEADAGAHDVDGGATTALALVERRRRVDDFTRTSFGRVRTARAPGPAQVTGWRAGVAAADHADVGRTRIAGRLQLGRGGR